MGEMLGVSKNYIYMLEKGRPPGRKIVELIRQLEAEIQTDMGGQSLLYGAAAASALSRQVREMRTAYGGMDDCALRMLHEIIDPMLRDMPRYSSVRNVDVAASFIRERIEEFVAHCRSLAGAREQAVQSGNDAARSDGPGDGAARPEPQSKEAGSDEPDNNMRQLRENAAGA